MFVPVPMADFAAPLVNAAATAASVYENLLVASSPILQYGTKREARAKSVSRPVSQSNR